jgi:heme/copper-type cytochrome/quinol oxidase subunit 4
MDKIIENPKIPEIIKNPQIPEKPYYFPRRYDYDIPLKANENKLIEYSKRTALIALPFLSLYKPFTPFISLSMNGMRSLNLLTTSIKAGYNLNLKLLLISLVQTAIAISALAFTFFSFPIGVIIITAFDLIQSLVNSINFLRKRDYENSIRELLSVISSTLYIAIFLTGSLEVILISIAIQALCSFYESKGEFSKGKYPEAFAKVLMGMIRIYQVRNQFLIIKRRNFLFSLEKFKLLKKHIEKGRDVKHLKDSELKNLDKKIKEKAVILEDADNEKYDFGSHFHGYGKDKVKGLNICFTETDGGITLDFKINHVAREKLKTLVKELHKITENEKDLQDFLSFSQTKAKNISVEKLKFKFPKKKINIGKIQRIEFEGLGSISIGASKNIPNIYNKVFIKMDKNKNLNDLHSLLSFLDLDSAICKSSETNIERLKIGQLFRAFYPREATPFERSEEFFDLPIDKLKEQIIEKVPNMEEILKTHLPKMEQREILPGKIRYSISGISKEVEKLGGECLTSSITGSYSKIELFNRTASILKMGMLSSESRYSGGMKVHGLSTSSDFYEGSADSVFTQMITKEHCSQGMPLEDFSYYYKENGCQFIFSKEVLETISYQYLEDNFGSRIINPGWDLDSQSEKCFFPYSYRPSIFEFTEELNNDPSWYWGPEVMIKERIPPSYIKGIIVSNEQMKNDLSDYLRNKNIVTEQHDIEKILNIPIDKFIRIGTNLSKELIA